MISKKNLLNLALLIFVFALAGIIFFSEEVSSDLEPLTRIKPATISTIVIRHNDTETRLKKQTGDQGRNNWQIEQPVAIPANDFRVNSLLKLLNAPVHKRYRSSDIDLDSIGLTEPQTVIRFDDIEISFGITNPVTKLRFVRIGEAVSTIEDIYFPLLNSHFSTLVSLDLLPDDSIEKLILINQTISKDEQGRWQSNIDISADKVAGILDAWQSSQAFGIHQYMERKQLGEVFIYPQGKPFIRYQITDTDPWLILARPEIGLEYHLDIDAYDQLILPTDNTPGIGHNEPAQLQ